MNQTDLIHSLVPGIPGLGSIALAAIVLLTAVGAVFFAFHRRQKQIVGRGGIPFFVLPRVIRAVAIVFGIAAALAFLPSPEGPPDAAAQSSGNPFNPRPGEPGGDPIVGDGIVNAPLVFDVAVHLYLEGSGGSETTVTNWSRNPSDVVFEMSVYHSRDNGGDTHWVTHEYTWSGGNYVRSTVNESDFDFYGNLGWYTGPGSSHDCDIERRATISEHFLDGRDSASSYVHLYAGNGKAVVYSDDIAWPYYVPIYYYDVEPLFPWY